MKTQADLSAKPYFKCIDCQHRKDHRCNFIRTSEMPLYEWCVYIRAMKAINGLTNDSIAREAGVSVKTIERIMALNCEQDIMRETARLIELAVCGSATHFPCYLDSEEEFRANEQQLQNAMKELDFANAELQSLRDADQRSMDHLLAPVSDLRKEIEYLRTENDRKAKIIDKLLDR